MKKIYLLIFLFIFFPIHSFAECEWSENIQLQPTDQFYYQYCDDKGEAKAIKIGEIILKPTKSFQLVFPACPECNELWGKISPNKNRMLIFVKNEKYDRNTWIINLKKHKIEFFTELSKGKHLIPIWVSDEELVLAFGGMGYRTDYYFKFENDAWKQTDVVEVDVKLN